MYITSQILVFIGLIIDLIGKCLKRKGQVLTFNIIASLFYTLSYIFLISWLAMIVNFLFIIRSLWFMYLTNRDDSYKKYIIPIFCILSIFIINLFIFWENALDLILLASITISTIGFSLKKMLHVRISMLVNSLLFIVYNFTLQGYINMLCDLMGIIISFSAIIIYDIIPFIQKKSVKNIDKIIN